MPWQEAPKRCPIDRGIVLQNSEEPSQSSHGFGRGRRSAPTKFFQILPLLNFRFWPVASAGDYWLQREWNLYDLHTSIFRLQFSRQPRKHFLSSKSHFFEDEFMSCVVNISCHKVIDVKNSTHRFLCQLCFPVYFHMNPRSLFSSFSLVFLKRKQKDI